MRLEVAQISFEKSLEVVRMTKDIVGRVERQLDVSGEVERVWDRISELWKLEQGNMIGQLRAMNVETETLMDVVTMAALLKRYFEFRVDKSEG